MRSLASVLSLSAALLLAPPAIQTAHAQTDPRAEASTHFQRGTDLFNEGRFDAALAEFQRAYDLAPAAPVLYNLGRVHAELGHPVDAAHAFERYLTEGGTAITPARHAEVEAALARERARIGQLTVHTNVDGAVISVDGVDVATTPLPAPLELGSGTHVIGVRAPGHLGITREIAVAGTDQLTLEIELRREVEPRGTLRIASTLDGVRVRVDGREVGTTPLGATLPVPAGDHDVSGERAGYLGDARRVHVDEGADVDVSLHLTPDPAAPPETLGELELRLPPSPAVVRIDDEPATAAPLHVRIGPHRITIELPDREAWSGTITIDRGRALELAPPFRWTAAERAARIGAADGQRAAGIGLTFSGLALMLVGVPLAIWNELEIASTDAAIVALNADYARMCDPFDPTLCGPLRDRASALASAHDRQDVLRVVSFATMGLGVALAAIGVPLWTSAPSADQVDAAAHATLRVGPSGLVLDGTF